VVQPDLQVPEELAHARKHPLAKCEECPLWAEGQFVPSVGPKTAKTAIVGEAPGAYEARRGEPFIGESGQLLNNILRHHKIPRKEVFLSNACLCRQPDGATPTAPALRACRPRLLAELEACGCETVVALGNSAAQSILDTKVGITKLRVGSGRPSPDLPNLRVISTFHPAAALRQPDFFPSIASDFGKIFGTTSTWYEPKWRAFDEPEIALQALSELRRLPGRRVVIDIEAGIEKDVSFDHPNRHTLLCIGIGYQRGKVVVIGETALKDQRVREALTLYLLTHDLVAQNGKFDLKGLRPHLKADFVLWCDTLLKHYCIDERQGVHSLEYMGIELVGAPNWKGMLDQYRKKGESYAVIPRHILYQYNAYDVHVTDLVDEVLDSTLGKRPELQKLHQFLCRASDQLKFIELNGLGVDLAYNHELAVGYQASLAILRERIAGTIPFDAWRDQWALLFPARANKLQQFNPNSPKQVQGVVEGIFGYKLPMKLNQQKEYRKTTDAEALEGLLALALETPAEEFFRRMLEHRKEAKLYGTYVKGIRRRIYRGRVFPTFLLHGTTTGRLSCRNPNLQNIPRASIMRRQFVPVSPENVFVEGDFGQNELRVLCWLAQDEFLRDIFNDPTRDLFDEFRPRLYGDTSGLDKAALKELRIRIKAYVYGLSYGREAKSISIEFGIPLSEAERGMKLFFNVIPDVVKFRELTRNKVLNGHDLVTPYGRHRRFWLITKSNKKDVMNEALAFLPQSIASDICLDAFTHLRPELKGIGYIRNIVHDSMLGECHESKVEEMKALMRKHMLEAARRVVGDYVRFQVDFGVGRSWGELD
jgi:uracil-DNA glycosylase family 4